MKFGPKTDANRSRIPVYVVTGFMGAGKTTLIRSILEKLDRGQTALLVNEFASGGIDQIVLSSDQSMVEGLFGCMCCRPTEDIVSALDRLRQSSTALHRLKRVMIETSGLSAPSITIQELLGDLRFLGHFYLAQVICVIDVSTIETSQTLYPESQDQIATSDLIFLTNLADIYAPTLTLAMTDIHHLLASHGPEARILGGQDGIAELIEQISSHPAADWPVSRTTHFAADHPNSGGHASGRMASLSVDIAARASQDDMEGLAAVLSIVSTGLLRAKVIAPALNAPGSYLLNWSNGKFQGLEHLPALQQERCSIYLVGTGLDLDALAALLKFHIGAGAEDMTWAPSNTLALSR